MTKKLLEIASEQFKFKKWWFQFCFFTIDDVAITIETSLRLYLVITWFVVVVRIPFVSVSPKSNKRLKIT